MSKINYGNYCHSNDLNLDLVQVCNAWISSGVSRDASDLKRIQQLLVSSLQNLQTSTHELIISRFIFFINFPSTIFMPNA